MIVSKIVSIIIIWPLTCTGRGYYLVLSYLHSTLSAENYLIIISKLFVGSFGEDLSPQFVGSVHNITVVLGREAVLSCSVARLKDYKVMWTKVRIITIFCCTGNHLSHNTVRSAVACKETERIDVCRQETRQF